MIKDKINRDIIIWCVVVSAIAHGFRWFNMAFCHDSLLVNQRDGSWQLFLGRWFVPFWLLVRGEIAVPWLIAVFSVAFLSLAIILLSYLLGLRRRTIILPLCAVVASCPVITCLYSAFISATDIHMLAFLLCVVSVLMLSRLRYGWICGGIVLAFSMALYQTYLEVAVVLIVFLLIKLLVNNAGNDVIWKLILRSICYFACGGLVYYVAWRSAIWLLGYNLSTLPCAGAYNSLTGMSELAHSDLWYLGFKAYRKTIEYVLLPETLSYRIVGVANLFLVLLGLSRAVIASRSFSRRLLCFILLALLPLAANFVYILSQGTVHTLMIMSIVMFYAGVLMTCSFQITPKYRAFDQISRYAIIAIVVIVSFNYTVYANQCHLKKNLDEQSTLSVMTRVIDRIERFDGYVQGDTVVFVGDLNTSSIRPNRIGFEKNAREMVLTSSGFSVTYLETYKNYFTDVLAYPIVFGGREKAYKYSKEQEVIQMPSFPAEGCVKKKGNDIVVKLSNEEVQKRYDF